LIFIIAMLKKLLKPFRKLASKIREAGKENLRSKKWPAVRDRYIKGNPACESCGSIDHVQVHHVKPFHLHPEFELDESNLISLCMGDNECHLTIGHGDSFRCYNPNVRDDAKKFMKSSSSERKILIESIKKNRLV